MKRILLFPAVLAAMAIAGATSGNEQLIRDGHLDRFVAEYTDKNAYIAAGSALNMRICEEGMVLLKNVDDMLPLKNVKKVSVFGKASTNIQKGGGGSGASSNKGEDAWDLQRSLEDVGLELNPTLTAFYKDNNKSGSGRSTPTKYDGSGYNTIGETAIGKYTDDVKNSFSEYNDLAIVLLARAGTEGADCLAADARDFDSDPFTDNHYLQLSQNETDMFEMIEENFDNIVVLINSGNIFQCDELDAKDKVKAILWMGTPGQVGAKAVGEILTGAVNPSGRTVDTWTRDFTTNPTFQNWSDNRQSNKTTDASGKPKYAPADTMFNPDGTPTMSLGTDSAYKDHSKPRWADEKNKVVSGGLNGVKPASYVSYEEGVYVDYRYYETRYADFEAEEKGSGDTWYDSDEGVIFPFGYGLSYTTFEQHIKSIGPKANSTLDKNTKKINVTVTVKNIGKVAGKEVVELYWKAPYIPGEIEKPYEILCAFAKTKELNPGESQDVKLSFYLQDQASYDFDDANNNDFMGYELDAGEYKVSLNKNAHETIEEVKFNIKEGIKYENDRYTGHKVENRFSGNDFFSSLPLENDVEFTQLHRNQWEETFPKAPTMEDRTLKEGSRVEEFFNHEFYMADIEILDNGYLPSEAKKTKEDIEALGWEQRSSALSQSNRTQLIEMAGVDLDDDEKWDEFLNQFTYSELETFVADEAFHSPSLSAIGKPQTTDSDGPSQYNIIGWAGAPTVAATFNVEIAHKQGEMVGTEAHPFEGDRGNGKYGWFGPAVNTHRSPFGGRNFEYYAADPFLMGRIAANVVAGATEKGVYCYFKHFCVNDQERGREGVSTYLTEQALREIYLRSFQMVFQEAKATGVMSSYNRLGIMETAASYRLLTNVLREEWGFKGAVLSDMDHHGNSSFNHKCYENINNRAIAGCNGQLENANYANEIECKWSSTANNGKGAPTFTYNGETYESYTWWYTVRMRARENLWQYANCGGLDKTLVQLVDGINVQGEENNRIDLVLDKKVNIAVSLDSSIDVGGTYKEKTISNIELSLDRYPLPTGLEFDGTNITGTPTEAGMFRVNFLLDLEFDDGSTDIVANEVYFYVEDPSESAKEVNIKGGGCKGSVEATASLTLVALAALGLISFASMRKRKEQE